MGLKPRKKPHWVGKTYKGLSHCKCGAWSFNPCRYCGHDRGIGDTRPTKK